MTNISVLVTSHTTHSTHSLKKTIDSVLRLLPNSPLLLCTWKEENLNLCKNIQILPPPRRPLVLPDSEIQTELDFNDQLVLRKKGLKEIKTDYVLILEGGVRLTSLKFIESLGEKAKFNNPAKFHEKILIAGARYRLSLNNPALVPFYFDNWIQAGKREDLLRLWKIPLLNLRKIGALKEGFPSPALPAQSALIRSFLIEIGTNPHLMDFQHYSQTTPNLIHESEYLLTNCFKILPPWNWRCEGRKDAMSHREWLDPLNKRGFYSKDDLISLNMRGSHA